MMITVRLLHDLAHVGLDDALALVVERAGRLVEDQDRRVGGERPGDGDALALAARQVGAALLDHRVVALGQLGDELVGARRGGRWRSTWARGMAGLAKAMLSWMVRLNSRFSCSTTPMLARSQAGIDLGEVGAVEQDLALVRQVEALDQLGQRRLARARRPDDADHLAGPDRERDVP